jgi:hypothetical protein
MLTIPHCRDIGLKDGSEVGFMRRATLYSSGPFSFLPLVVMYLDAEYTPGPSEAGRIK